MFGKGIVMNKDYCVCIRTLGKAGDKYQAMLDSLTRQSIQPKKILVFIPFGYDLPKETIGIEQYIRCEKGMVHQRALPFDEVDTNWILFLDDDVYLEDNSVERLFAGLDVENGDAISASVFRAQYTGWRAIIKSAMSFAFPRRDDGWAVKHFRNCAYSYNIKPSKSVLPTQSTAGPTLLVRKDAFLSVHFEDERWMDTFRYILGEDMSLTYKLFIHGYRLLVHYDSGCVHLDARTGNLNNALERYDLTQTLWLIRWYRIFYNLKYATWKSKTRAVLSYLLREFWTFFFNAVPFSVKYRDFSFILAFFRKYQKSFAYIRTDSFQSLPHFDEYIER